MKTNTKMRKLKGMRREMMKRVKAIECEVGVVVLNKRIAVSCNW